MHHPLCSSLATGQMVAVPPCYLSLHILSGIHGLVRVVQGEQYRGHPKQLTECGDWGSSGGKTLSFRWEPANVPYLDESLIPPHSTFIDRYALALGL